MTMMQRRRWTTCSTTTMIGFLWCLSGACAFVTPPPSFLTSSMSFHRCRRETTSTNYNDLHASPSSLCSSFSDESDNTDDSSSSSAALEQMRCSLEASWNTQSMGDTVPSDPQSAAKAAAQSLISASSSQKNVMMVDLLLPSYDITQGFNLYDDVLAVEFCIALLANFEKGKSVILVKDQKALTSVERVLNARERRAIEQQQQQQQEEMFALDVDEDEDYDDEDDDDKDDDVIATEDKKSASSPAAAVEYYDDFADFDNIGKQAEDDDDSSSSISSSNAERQAPPSTPTESSTDKQDEVDAFRQQLMSSWESSDTAQGRNPVADDASSKRSELPKQPRRKRSVPPTQPTSPPPAAAPPSLPKSYRLASMLGDDTISTGSDMMGDVITALKKHALPIDDEDVICILSATTKEEMLAVRQLVAKYESTKTIILVNCKFDPLPRELLAAETVYSILPLVAKPVVSETNLFGKEQENAPQQQQPKVVVMRRYPGDWEIYVDANGSSGFELVDSAKASQTSKKGPSMEWIAGCVKRHLQTKFGQ